MILHFASDEKFIDNAIEKFESVAPGASRYIIVSDGTPLKLVKSQLAEQLTDEDAARLVQSSDCRAVVFHGLSRTRMALLRHLRQDARAAWIGWGFDYYPTLLRHAYPTGLYEPMTLPLARAVGRMPNGRFYRLRACLRGIRNYRSASTRGRLKKIDFFIPVLRSEWELACQLNPWFKARYLPWYYAVDKAAERVNTHRNVVKRNILIGNSADLTNNHIDAFAALARRVRPKDYDRVIVPLSYGRSDITTAKIEAAGRHYFEDRFMPLYDFLALEEYRKIVASCHTVILNHVRQQGAGNASIAALLGARIVLNASSPLRAELDRRGIVHETIDDFDIGELDEDTMRANREAECSDIVFRADPQKTLDLVKALE